MNDSAAHRLLKGPEKVAALLLAMDRSIATRLLKRFDPFELREITRSAADLGAVSSTSIEGLVEEFTSNFNEGADLIGTAGEAKELLSGALPPEQVTDIMSDVLGTSSTSVWDRLSTLSDAALGDFLAYEHPQTSAFVLSRITTTAAAAVLMRLPQNIRAEVAQRISSLKRVDEVTVRMLESVLQSDLLNKSSAPAAEPNKRLAEIINKMDREQMEEVLDSIAAAKPEMAQNLRNLLFTFDDIVKLSVKARAVLFDKAPPERVIMSLKGKSQEFREFVLSSMTNRARRMVEQELATAQNSPAREINKARKLIADLVLELAAKGEIELVESTDDGGGE